MIAKEEALIKHQGGWLHFSQPYRVVTATRLKEVRTALHEIEESVNSRDWHAAGFLSYEAAPAFDSAMTVKQGDDFPLLWFGLYPAPRVIELPEFAQDIPNLDWQPSVERQVYNAAIKRIKEHIAEGKTYQVNYTMRLNSPFEGSAWDLFLHLAQSQNKYAACIDTGRFAICSASPELCFQLDGETITGRPMKGTVKRGRTTFEDRQQADWLFASEKNRAENVMIVDMIRNDIGRIAETGSVSVPELFAIEKYPTLIQMTSTVQAKTRASITEIISALFPCASITGAPKVSTMNIIASLETTPRRVYTGSIGFIAPKRKAQFNVAIRTAIVDREKRSAQYGAGGGIVWDSTSEDEYGEALLKSRVLTDPPRRFSLLETILWTPQGGYFLLDRHIDRMADSAEYFDFGFSKDLLKDGLLHISRKFTSPMRVRAASDKNGGLTIESKPIGTHSTLIRACLSVRPVDAGNPFLYHKTTAREVYEAALSRTEGYDDVLLFNKKNELTEFTIGNLVAEREGEWVTPPAACGLLAGTFRAELLESGMIRERIIRRTDLKYCRRIYLINSVRKWVAVDLFHEHTATIHHV